MARVAHGPADDGQKARRHALTPEDARKIQELQAEIAGWEQDGTAQGSLGPGVDGWTLGAGPVPDATGSCLIRLKPEAHFLSLIEEGKLVDSSGPKAVAAIKPCNGAE